MNKLFVLIIILVLISSQAFAFNYGWQNDVSKVTINPTTIIYNGTNQFITNNISNNYNNTWGSIIGNIYDQLDLINLLNIKAGIGSCPSGYVVQNTTLSGVDCVLNQGSSSTIIDSNNTLYYNYQTDTEGQTLYIEVEQ